jgi:hypothetical protein
MEEKKESINQNVVLVGMVMFLIGIVIGGLLIAYTGEQKANSISETDMNTLKGLAYYGGFCERLNLDSSVYIQQDQNSKKYYGVPICVERTDTNA